MNPTVRLFLLPAALLTAMVASAADLGPTHKWRIELNHKTDQHGALILRIAPAAGEPVDVETKFPADMRENHAARLLCDTLQASLDEQTYHVERDDGEDCLVKARDHRSKFMVTLVSSTLTGLEIRIKHD